nr:transport protein particle subunit [Quercus suber]
MDRFSPIAPAQIRVLVLPIGQIERHRFTAFLRRLQREVAIVRLGEVPELDANSLLAPQAFPQGSLLFNFTSSAHDEQHQHFSPYELFREPLLVIGVAEDVGSDSRESAKQLSIAREHLKELYPRVVHRQLLVLQTTDHVSISDIDDAILVANSQQDHDPAIRRSVCQMSASFLQELATYAKAMQASPSIQTPGQNFRSVSKAVSLRPDERQSGSGHNTPTHVDPSTPTTDEQNSRPPSLQFATSPPATSFDQMKSANPALALEGKTNNKSKSGAKASSQEPVSLHGFGAGTTAEKARARGKARVGITIGHIHMMAGQWNEALRVLIEHTGKARSLSDNLWHAKGLEGLLVCLILCAWAGIDFTIPTICLPVSERTTAAHVKRLSISLSGEAKQQSAESAYQASIQRLSASLPDITKSTLSLYRSGEGSLELPALIIHEAVVRFSKLLAIVTSAKGELHAPALSQIVFGPASPRSLDTASTNGGKLMQKTAIADMLGQAQPTNNDNIPLGDHISLLAGIASVYALLRMNRRKAIIIKDILLRLSGALIQARKLGAAEMGIHPAASLSAETGAETILSVVEERGGINEMLSDLAQIYGLELVSDSNREPVDVGTFADSSLGGTGLKMTMMRELVAFCEASPDPYGVVRLTASLLMSARPVSAVDEQEEGGSALLFKEDQARFATYGVVRLTASLLMSARPVSAVDEQEEGGSALLLKEDQARFATVINRTIGISKHLGLPDVQASYWDPFLVRGINFQPPNASQLVTKRLVTEHADDKASGNPLIYDPNANRISIATQQTVVLVANEVAKCIVTLQNPLDISAEIERLTFLTEGVEVRTDHEPFILGPSRLQQMPISVFPDSAGALKITACRVKLRDCREQVFSIFNRPWSASAPFLVKEHGQEIRVKKMRCENSQAPEPATLTAVVVPTQPSIVLKAISLSDSSVMLLDGETRAFEVVLYNDSSVPATIFEATGTPQVLHCVRDCFQTTGSPGITIEPKTVESFKMEISGRAGVSEAKVSFVYGTNDILSDANTSSHYVRRIDVPVTMTVNAALRVQRVEVSSIESGDAFLLSFDLGNVWPRPLSYHCTTTALQRDHAPVTSSPEQKGTLLPGSVERVFLRITHEQLALHRSLAAEVQQDFWNQICVSWHGDARSGTVDLSNLPLSPEALNTLRGSPVQLALQLLPTPEIPDPSVGSFMTCRATLQNRRPVRSPPLLIQLRLRPAGADPAAHDHRHVATTPSLSRLLPPLHDVAATHVDFVVCPLVAGRLQIVATCVQADLDLDLETHFGAVSEEAEEVRAGEEKAVEKWQAQRAIIVTVKEPSG